MIRRGIIEDFDAAIEEFDAIAEEMRARNEKGHRDDAGLAWLMLLIAILVIVLAVQCIPETTTAQPHTML